MKIAGKILGVLLKLLGRAELPPEARSERSKHKEKDLGKGIDHAKAGYQNGQDIIKFVDTKTAFLAGACITALGFTVQLIKGSSELPSAFLTNILQIFDKQDIWFYVTKSLVVGSLLFGAVCLFFCISSLVGRTPLENRSTVLFPFYGGTRQEREYCRIVSSGMSDREIAEEYENQVWNIGLILKRKLDRHRTAARMFLVQIIVLCVGCIIFLLCVGL